MAGDGRERLARCRPHQPRDARDPALPERITRLNVRRVFSAFPERGREVLVRAMSYAALTSRGRGMNDFLHTAVTRAKRGNIRTNPSTDSSISRHCSGRTLLLAR